MTGGPTAADEHHGFVEARVAFVFRGDRAHRDAGTLDNSRLAPVAEALADVGLVAEPAVYDEEFADEVRAQLLEVRAVLVWVDPVAGTADRAVLDEILREVAAAGVWVSAHPDTIIKMGTKEVLYRTRHLGWGTDTHLYCNAADLAAGLRARLAGGPRVLKQLRGNGGIGVWKVQLRSGAPGRPPADGDLVVVQSARQRDGTVEELTLGDFMARCEKYFGYAAGHGRLIDQPFQSRIVEGLTRCYLVQSEVVGFCRQHAPGRSPADTEATVPDDRVFGLPSAKTMFPPDHDSFRFLRRSVEDEWVPAMQRALDIRDSELPALWDADFLFGPPTDDGDSYVLSEINVSAVAPFPSEAVPVLARAVATALARAD